MFQRSQWVKVLPGASGSSIMITKEAVLSGMFSMVSGGEMFSPSAVYLVGICPPLENAELVIRIPSFSLGSFGG